MRQLITYVNIAQASTKGMQDGRKRVGKVLGNCRWRLTFDHATKWHKHKPESVLENETLKILWDFVVQTDYLFPARRFN